MSKHKGRRNRRFTICMLLTGLFLILFSQCTYAASLASVSLTVDQIFTITGDSVPGDEFVYTLTGQQPGNPMPAGSKDGIYTFLIQGTDEVVLGPISFQSAGVYTYVLEQSILSVIEGYTYDTRIFKVQVIVTEVTPGDMNANLLVYNEQDEKVQEIIFKNGYAEKQYEPAPPKTSPRKTAPGTGDESHQVLYLIMLIASGCILLVADYTKKRYQYKKEKE